MPSTFRIPMELSQIELPPAWPLGTASPTSERIGS